MAVLQPRARSLLACWEAQHAGVCPGLPHLRPQHVLHIILLQDAPSNWPECAVPRGGAGWLRTAAPRAGCSRAATAAAPRPGCRTAPPAAETVGLQAPVSQNDTDADTAGWLGRHICHKRMQVSKHELNEDRHLTVRRAENRHQHAACSSRQQEVTCMSSNDALLEMTPEEVIMIAVHLASALNAGQHLIAAASSENSAAGRLTLSDVICGVAGRHGRHVVAVHARIWAFMRSDHQLQPVLPQESLQCRVAAVQTTAC